MCVCICVIDVFLLFFFFRFGTARDGGCMGYECKTVDGMGMRVLLQGRFSLLFLAFGFCPCM